MSLADLGPHALVGIVHLDAQACLLQLLPNLVGVVVVAVGDGDELRLYRRQPHREGPAVVFDEHAEESLQGTQKRAVNHVGAMLLAIRTDVGHVEALWHVEVELDGRALPQTAQGIFDVDVNLGAVEDRFTFHPRVREPLPLQGLDQRPFRHLPRGIATDVLLLALRIAH